MLSGAVTNNTDVARQPSLDTGTLGSMTKSECSGSTKMTLCGCQPLSDRDLVKMATSASQRRAAGQCTSRFRCGMRGYPQLVSWNDSWISPLIHKTSSQLVPSRGVLVQAWLCVHGKAEMVMDVTIPTTHVVDTSSEYHSVKAQRGHSLSMHPFSSQSAWTLVGVGRAYS